MSRGRRFPFILRAQSWGVATEVTPLQPGLGWKGLKGRCRHLSSEQATAGGHASTCHPGLSSAESVGLGASWASAVAAHLYGG